MGASVSVNGEKDRHFSILIVDDSKVALKMMTRLMTKNISKNIEVRTSANCDDALEVIRESIESGCQYDGLIVDFVMPMLGHNFCRIVREMGYTNVIIGTTSGIADCDLDTIFCANGADIVLEKPVQFMDVMRVIGTDRRGRNSYEVLQRRLKFRAQLMESIHEKRVDRFHKLWDDKACCEVRVEEKVERS